MKLLLGVATVLLVIVGPAHAFTIINEFGAGGAPVLVAACPAVTQILTGSKGATSWAIMPEGNDIRCQLGDSANNPASPPPSAAVGFLFKSNVLVPETTFNLGSSVSTLRMDCCGVAAAVSTDTWHE